MLVALGLLALLVALTGALTAVAGRRLDPRDDGGRAPSARVAAAIDERLRRTGQVVDVLVDPRPDAEVLRGEEPLPRRAAAYRVVGIGLLGVGLVLVVGLLLLTSG
ncbi:hypothetical protein [Nocardioides sp. SYSU D00038]|uniref:hypothetical protein n=1 Tax=Nocardioides sp. SYSU D00038 TaxID=2812554 RepID=UPI001967CB05|nr:hypothetical protein [Nocardioides sp. SYSU D00038]